MADTTFIITPSGGEYSMVSDTFFNSLDQNNYRKSADIKSALDWLLNIKRFCVMEQSNPEECFRGVYEATYEISDFESYNTPVTNLGESYTEHEIGGSDSSEPTEDAGEVAQTSPRNPHKYTLQEDENNSEDTPPPSELNGNYLGAFFHHKGSWYASFDDMENVGLSGKLTTKEITNDLKKAEKGEGDTLAKKKIFVEKKFYGGGSGSETSNKECVCPCIFQADSEGGDEGYSSTFQLKRKNIKTTLDIFFQAYTIKDSITVTASPNGESYSSGCISDSISTTLELPNGAESITVTVGANCEGDSGTVWIFDIKCVEDEPP